MLLYALTIFVGAFLLFMVQPLIAKLILPWFGGSAAVWTTCLLFFQVALLLGYFYAFVVVGRLRRRAQARLHVLLLGLSLLALPIIPRAAWKPSGLEDPAFRILGLLAFTVGLPYFLLSSTGPLLQAWYAKSRREAMPYRLFSLSNAASLVALASYPALVEPAFSARHQALGWSLAYAVGAVLCATLALRLNRGGGQPAEVESVNPQPAAPATLGLGVRLLWVALAACASTLLFAVTNHLSQNVAAIPLLWVFPLGLYLASFILCFGGWYRRQAYLRFLAVALGGMTYALAPEFVNASLAVLIPLYCAGLFLACMVCHGELERLKPPPVYLTSFYLMMALGGALGGIFVGLIAPRCFRGFYELPIGMASCAVLVIAVLRRDPSSRFYKARWQPSWLGVLGLTGALVVGLSLQIRNEAGRGRVTVRNFYGGLRVIDLDPIPLRQVVPGMPTLKRARRKLMNGTIDHGLQFLTPERRRQPTTYYGVRSGVGLALREAGRRSNLRVGVIGLGAGTLAAYGRPGDRYTLYELNPLVIRLAETEFTFLSDSQATVDVVPGDARLALEQEPPQGFDVLAVDAFSSDSIPVHLLTLEAFRLYFHHLKDSGVVAVHITNRYLNLRPVVEAAAQSLGKTAMVIDNDRDDDDEVFRARWVLVSSRQDFFDNPDIEEAGTLLEGKANPRPWTDDYSNLFRVIGSGFMDE